MPHIARAPRVLPLRGLRVLVGRARRQASALATGLKELGAEIIEIPFIEIRPPLSYKPLDSALKRISEYDWLVLTSVNGVEALASRMKSLKIGFETLKQLNVVAIGPATRKAVEEFGLKVSVLPKQYVAESVVEALRGKVAGKRVLLARAKVARDVIPRELRKMGARLAVVEAYQTVVPTASQKKLRSALSDKKRRPDVIAFTSSSSVRNFLQLLGEPGRPHARLKGIRFASIGPITSATLRELALPVDIEAAEFTIPGLIQAIVSAESITTEEPDSSPPSDGE